MSSNSNNSQKIKLYGFNNLTKTLSFNIYDLCYAETHNDRKAYVKYIDEKYNSENLTNILRGVTKLIGANILNIAKQDYEPQGASVTILISEEKVPLYVVDETCNQGHILPMNLSVVGHLDKSHITVHTYPETHPTNGLSSFRVDIDVSTCGKISPLKALDFLINSFQSDIIKIDYKVRGFTRSQDGGKLFEDQKLLRISDYISQELKALYYYEDFNLREHSFYHSRFILNKFDLDDYLFNIEAGDLSGKEHGYLSKLIKNEMMEIYRGGRK